MNWHDLAGTLAKAGLTGLGTALGGPLGGTIGSALGSAMATALGVEPSPDAVAAAVEADPEAAAARLKDLEQSRQAELGAFRAELADVADARATALRLVRAGSPLAWAPVVISCLIFAIVVAVIGFVGAGRLADNGIVVGWALAAGTTVLTYWLGSSNGSRRNGDAVRAIARSAAETGPRGASSLGRRPR